MKKRQSKKLVIEVNPPTEESQPKIKLDFAAIKKKNGTTYEFVLEESPEDGVSSLQSFDDDDEEGDGNRGDMELS